jgi:hypothetical protein
MLNSKPVRKKHRYYVSTPINYASRLAEFELNSLDHFRELSIETKRRETEFLETLVSESNPTDIDEQYVDDFAQLEEFNVLISPR